MMRIALPDPTPATTGEPYVRVRDLERDLRAAVDGEVRFDPGSRGAYSTDSSNYRQVPARRRRPHATSTTASRRVAVCRQHGAPGHSRAAAAPAWPDSPATSAVIIDWSKYCNHLVSVDADGQDLRRRARHRAGRAQRASSPSRGLMFGPKPATHDHCTLGGMIGNNSCGVDRAGLRQDRRQRRAPRGPDLRRRPDVGRARPATRSTPRSCAAGGRRAEIYRALRRAARPLRRADPRRLPPTSRAGSPATTSTPCCPRTASTSPGRSWAPRAPWSPCCTPSSTLVPTCRPRTASWSLGYPDIADRGRRRAARPARTSRTSWRAWTSG